MTNERPRLARRRALQRVAGLSALALSLPAPWGATAIAEQPSGPRRVRDLYDKDRSFSALTESSVGERIDVIGYMAPPLRADSNFFVLTARPMTTCPFCSDAADWPDDIVAVYTKRRLRSVAFNVDIVVSGRLDMGEHVDAQTGFVSLLRLVDADYRRR